MIPIKGNVRPIRDHILVTDMNFGEIKTSSGIILRSDDGKTEGIKPRWGKVWAVGSEQTDVKVGDWILVEHGRWTRGIKIKLDDDSEIDVRRVDASGILGISDEKPVSETLGTLNTPTAGQAYDFSDLQRAF